ncbi:hypothetical protein RFM68_21220 [Mesorhizobium sp. MSK_1335]|uniref:ATP-grasp domain-containing protein n=1 Tax=Mesorhizobium montanum TaxID=3072323 RepID=A0ABU4ZNT2_9HYPH|nr:hypothetical protein [Mesorhizobium sp. MSK_1335]MDX8527024.1 hypothetical protein [Mesorhizobium sp. MSK_1335]
MADTAEVLNKYENADEADAKRLMSSEFLKLGFRTKTLGPLLIASANGAKCLLREGDTSFTAVTAYHMLKDKRLSRAAFKHAGVSFAEGKTFRIANKEAAREKVAEFGNAVLKPFDGRKGNGVSVNVTPATFEAAWGAALRRTGRRILVERYFSGGDEARYLVIDSECVAVAMRVPPTLLGDGKSTVGQLIEAKNELRTNNPHLGKRPIFVDDYRKLILASQGFNLDSIPPKGQAVVVDWKSNASTGGETRGITDLVHPSMKRIAERVARAIPGLHVGGVDILARDHTSKADPENYIVIEANTLPDLGLHLFPMYGRSVNVCKLIAESCARRMGFDAGPIGKAHQRSNGTGAVV